MKMTKMWISH